MFLSAVASFFSAEITFQNNDVSQQKVSKFAEK